MDGIVYTPAPDVDWWDTDWTQRVKLTFDNAAATEDLIGFPVMVVLDPEGESQVMRVTAEAGRRLAFKLDPEYLWGDAAALSAAAERLYVDGADADGYEAMEYALDEYEFRPNAGVHFIALSKLGRRIVDDSVTASSLLEHLRESNAVWHSIVRARFSLDEGGTLLDGTVPASRAAVGADSDAYAYLPDGFGGYMVGWPVKIEESGMLEEASSKADYVDPALDSGGTAWDLSLLQGAEHYRQSFGHAFVDVLARTIEEHVSPIVIASEPDAAVDVLTRTIIGPDEQGNVTASFDVRFSDDREAHAYDLLFVPRHDPGLLLGSIPVSIATTYQYDVVALDPDRDALAYELAGETHGATIDASTGRLAWSADAAGPYDFTVRASDGRGGRDEQTWRVTVGDTAAGNHPPEFVAIGLRDGEATREFELRLRASDPDGDLLTYRLVSDPVQRIRVPAGMKIDANRGIVSWTPTPRQAGLHTARVVVSDGRGGRDNETFTIKVTYPEISENRNPDIISSPRTTANLTETYRDIVRAVDLDSDPLRFDLPFAPPGMVIDAVTGEIVWQPRRADRGTQPVVVRVCDGVGGVALQNFDLDVWHNDPPRFTSNPVQQAAVGTQWTYEIVAEDPDGDELEYSLQAAPPGMTIDTATGRITWTPAAIGIYRIDVRALDPFGYGVGQIYDLQVINPANRHPNIVSIGPLVAEVGETYTYDVDGVDPDGDTLTYAVTVTPGPLNAVTVNATTGLIEWQPDSSEIGRSFHFAVTAFDPGGLGIEESYDVRVRPADQAPVITSQPVTTVFARQTYRYDVQATDPDGDELLYVLDTGSTDLAMAIDGYGRITWQPGLSDIGTHTVLIAVLGFRLGAVQSFELTVQRDTEAPQVDIRPSGNPVDAGARVVLIVDARDNVGVERRELILEKLTAPDGTVTNLNTRLAVDSRGRARTRVDLPGVYRFTARAWDAAGNVGTATPLDLTVEGIPATGLVATLLTPDDGQIVTEPVPIQGIVRAIDPQQPVNLIWTLTATVARRASEGIIFIASGTGQNMNGLLGTFDTTIVANGAYQILLEVRETVFDPGGGSHVEVRQAARVVNVEGRLKLGNFTIQFKDLEVPNGVLPITVSRTYDTLAADKKLDFGYGWKLDYGRPKVTVDLVTRVCRASPITRRSERGRGSR